MFYIHLRESKRKLEGTVLQKCSMKNMIQEPLKRVLIKQL